MEQEQKQMRELSSGPKEIIIKELLILRCGLSVVIAGIPMEEIEQRKKNGT